MGVLGAPRGDFWRLKSALDAILGVLGAPRGCLVASVWDFGAFEMLREAKIGVRGPADWGVASLIIAFLLCVSLYTQNMFADKFHLRTLNSQYQ